MKMSAPTAKTSSDMAVEKELYGSSEGKAVPPTILRTLDEFQTRLEEQFVRACELSKSCKSVTVSDAGDAKDILARAREILQALITAAVGAADDVVRERLATTSVRKDSRGSKTSVMYTDALSALHHCIVLLQSDALEARFTALIDGIAAERQCASVNSEELRANFEKERRGLLCLVLSSVSKLEMSEGRIESALRLLQSAIMWQRARGGSIASLLSLQLNMVAMLSANGQHEQAFQMAISCAESAGLPMEPLLSRGADTSSEPTKLEIQFLRVISVFNAAVEAEYLKKVTNAKHLYGCVLRTGKQYMQALKSDASLTATFKHCAGKVEQAMAIASQAHSSLQHTALQRSPRPRSAISTQRVATTKTRPQTATFRDTTPTAAKMRLETVDIPEASTSAAAADRSS